MGLTQKQVANIVGVDETTVFNWEHTSIIPRLPAMPKIIEFLGYKPLPTAHSFSEQLRLKRLTLGLTQKEAARKIGIDPSTLAHWEQGRYKPMRKLRESVRAFLHTPGGRA